MLNAQAYLRKAICSWPIFSLAIQNLTNVRCSSILAESYMLLGHFGLAIFFCINLVSIGILGGREKSGRAKEIRMEARTLILMGRTGNGKSSTGNSIVGRNVFKVGFSFTSVTQECQLEQTTGKDGRIINVIDTPGLFDTNSTNSKEFIQNQTVKCIDLAKGGVHGVLYVVSVKNRFTAEEAGVLDSLQLLFGPDIINYMVVVFTGGDELESDGVTFQDYLNDCTTQLKDILRRCNMRTVLFDNKTTSQTKKEKQITELIKQTDNIMAKNGGKPYSNELLRQAQGNSEKLVGRVQMRGAEPGRAYEEVERVNAEHIKQLNDMVEEKMQTIIKTYEEKSAHEQAARRQAEKTTEEALQLSKDLRKTKNKSENSPLKKFCNYAYEKLSSVGCTIM